MEEKYLKTLEYPKVLERLAAYASFSASEDLARSLKPTASLEEARLRLKRTSEARLLLDLSADVTVGGAHDIRPQADLAAHGGVLTPAELLDVKTTLTAARSLSRVFERQGEAYPALAELAFTLPPPSGIVDAISRTVSERGEVMDSASPRLASIRREVKTAYDRLMSKLQRLLNDPKTAPMLQEGVITQRGGRYVVPLRAEFKGKVRSIIHDQSSSGATLFVEPLAVVELNNEWRELQLAERDEERRILAELSGLIGQHAGELNTVVEALAAIDLALACAKYALDIHAVEPVLLPPRKTDGHHPGSAIRLYHARHPLLDPASVVPIDMVLDEDVYCLVITGPNTGGKTVSLKTVGLLAAMAQSGLHIPAQSGSELSLFKTIYADIGDEQSIEQSLSTFSAHITNIIRILRRADRSSLVLLDELGAGTDPQEGAALARAILSHLMERGITCLVATHYPELKAYAHSTPGMVNASVEFDLKTLRPTYHLTVGLPGRSNALAIASRLGLPAEIVEDARSDIAPGELRAEDLLDEIHRQRDLARRAREKAEQFLSEAQSKNARLANRLESIEDEREKVLEKARLEAETRLVDLQAELDEVRRSLARARQPLESIRPLQEKMEQAAKTLQQQERDGSAPPEDLPPLKVGDKVRLRSLKMEGEVTALGDSDLEVQVGALRIRARISDIDRRGAAQPPSEAAPQASPRRKPRAEESEPGPPLFRASPGMELDIRGQRAEDALPLLERHIDSAYLAGMPFVRIIHGKGTGRLRQVVREALSQSPHVAGWETGGEKEGGDGVTVARLHGD